ncbi:hypothetical protein ADEAN_000083400 [Angomonas deanei]|uniref:Uncharacterized protein n=1 Tax=Angomonas deanei TaxID=59799 RepID=A0A7G2C3U6_9TRYP|nr:hypothetical protein ADEAN_000083400 [Angomonas deanei]
MRRVSLQQRQQREMGSAPRRDRSTGRTSHRNSFRGVPGECYTLDEDTDRYTHVTDPEEVGSTLRNGRRIPLYIVRGRTDTSPTRRTPLFTRGRSPLGCSRLNPYCLACRIKYNLIIVDEKMNPVKWPSSKGRAMESFGDCRYHKGFLLGTSLTRESGGISCRYGKPSDNRMMFAPVDYIDVYENEAPRQTYEVAKEEDPTSDQQQRAKMLRQVERKLKRRLKALLWKEMPNMRDSAEYEHVIEEGLFLLERLKEFKAI